MIDFLNIKPSPRNGNREVCTLFIHKLDRYVCFPEGITLDCDQSSAIGESIRLSEQPSRTRGWNPDWGLKDPRQQSTKVEKHENIVSELSKT